MPDTFYIVVTDLDGQSREYWVDPDDMHEVTETLERVNAG